MPIFFKTKNAIRFYVQKQETFILGTFSSFIYAKIVINGLHKVLPPMLCRYCINTKTNYVIHSISEKKILPVFFRFAKLIDFKMFIQY